MIITITCNPAIDKTVYENKTVFDVGGKGINVAKVLNNLNTKSLTTGFVGKDNKDIVINDLNSLNIENHFIEVDGKVRTNTKKIIDNKLYEENEKGPLINDDDKQKLLEYLKGFSNEIVVLSGSCTNNIYYDLVSLLKSNDNYVILDCDGSLLVDGIKAKPNVIKPNKKEICGYLNCDYDEQAIINKVKELDIDLVCISLGEEGSLFIYMDDVYKVKPMTVDYKSATGAGDAMVAAMAYSKENNLDIIETIKLAVACASAACETEGTKAPKMEDILTKKERIELTKL